MNPLPPPPAAPPPLDVTDAPRVPADAFRRATVAIGSKGRVVFERGACTGTRMDTQPCDKPAFARKLCETCYRRAIRNGEITRLSLTLDDVVEKFLLVNAAREKRGVSLSVFRKAIGMKSDSHARGWLSQLEKKGMIVLRIGPHGTRWHLTAEVVPRPPVEPKPPPPPRPPPGRRGRKRRMTNDTRDTLRATARGWPKGW
jgi:hypothetical protein